MIDPSYEEKQDCHRAVQVLKDTPRRLETGCYMVWCPCLSREGSHELPSELKRIILDSHPHVELHVHTPRNDGFGIYGSGIFVINPPYIPAEQLQNDLPGLSKILAQDAGAYYVLGSKTK